MDANLIDCLREHLVVRLYRAAFGCFPERYRSEYGDELLYAVRMALADAEAQGGVSLLRFALRELGDLPLAILRARLRERRDLMNRRLGENFWGMFIVIGILLVLLSFPAYIGISLGYTESKGPFKNGTQVVDWDADGDLDVIVSHTRWEQVDTSWAGVGIWDNQGDGTFKLLRDRATEEWPFGGFAAGAGDVDQDGDLDIFTQDFGIRLMVNQGGLQGGNSPRSSRGAGSTHRLGMTEDTGIWAERSRWAI